jgi:hypothetical protein
MKHIWILQFRPKSKVKINSWINLSAHSTKEKLLAFKQEQLTEDHISQIKNEYHITQLSILD